MELEFQHGFMTRNNLRENLSWLLANIALSVPDAPPLPAARDLPGEHLPTTSDASPLFLALPPHPTTGDLGNFDSSSTFVQPAIPPSRYVTAHGSTSLAGPRQERLDEEGTEEGTQGNMGRLVPPSASKKRTLLLQQEKGEDQLLTPASTTGSGRLQQAYSASLRVSATATLVHKHASTRQEPYEARHPTPSVEDEDSFVDLTGSDDFTSSASNALTLGNDVSLWTERRAVEPEALADKRGKKRKSEDIIQPEQLLAYGTDEEFPDIYDFVEQNAVDALARATCSTPKTSKIRKMQTPDGHQAIKVKAKAHSVSQSTLTSPATARAPTLLEVFDDEPSNVKRSPTKTPRKREPSEVPPPYDNQATSPFKQKSSPGPDVELSSQPKTQPPQRTRRSSLVIQDSDDEWATPPTHNVSIASVPSASDPKSQWGLLVDCPQDDAPAVIAFDTPSKPRREESNAAVRSTFSPPTKGSTPPLDLTGRGRALKEPTPADSQSPMSSQHVPELGEDVRAMILKLFLATPSIIQRARNLSDEKLEQNRTAFRTALTSGQLGAHNVLRREKERLTREQAALDALSEDHQSYKNLVLQRDMLVEQIMAAYDQNLETPEQDRRLKELTTELSTRQKAFIPALLKAGINDVSLFEDLNVPPTHSVSSGSVVKATQIPHNLSQQGISLESTLVPGGNTQVIMQTQIPRQTDAPTSEAFALQEDEPFPRSINRQMRKPLSPVSRTAVQNTYRGNSFPTTSAIQSHRMPTMDEDLYDPDDEEDLFRDDPDLDGFEPTRQCMKPASAKFPRSPQRTAVRRTETFMSDNEYDDDIDMLEFAQDFELRQSSSENNSRRSNRSVFLETSGNAGSSKQKTTVKRIASTSTKTQFPPELMKFPWSPDVKRALKDRFRMAGFRHNQLEAINTTLSGKDAFVLMPTGGGKSLCYQLPAVVNSGRTSGITIVVSPLLSLMQDQVDHLRELMIEAVSFNGDIPAENKKEILQKLKTPNPDTWFSLLYVTPEMIQNSSAFRSALSILNKNKKLARLVIDEAHCVSQWGHDFRPDYKELGAFRYDFPRVPVMALTATATPNVIVDIKHNLGIDDCEVFTQSFNRPNLYYEVRKKEKDTVGTIAALINSKYQGKTGIVYTLSRKSAENTAKKLKELGIAAHHYHAGIEASEKSLIQKEWQKGKIKVVVATIAFGMGIDKPDVRFVVHQTLPKSLEGYYQETGRAGRDGQPSGCYLFYNYGDVVQLRKMINDGDGNEEQKERQRNMLSTVTAFADNQSDCRRVEILRYFGEAFEKADCRSSCDNCKANGVFEMKDFTDIAVAALEIIRGEKRMTLNQCTEVLLGMQKKKHNETLREGSKQYFGFAKKMPKHEIHRIIDKLAAEGALVEDNIFSRKAKMAFQYFLPGPNIYSFLRSKQKLMLAVQVKGGDGQAGASKSKKNTAKPGKLAAPTTLESSRLLPPSTNISSPAAQKRGKGKAPVSYDGDCSDEEEAYETHANGYAKDDFVVADEDASSDFETMEPFASKRKKHKQGLLGPPISQDVELASLDEIHKDITAAFLEEAAPLAEEIRNANNLRQAIFTRLQLRAMAMHWTLSLDAMKNIPSIDKDKVTRFGARFLPKIREWHQKYQEVMGPTIAKPLRSTTPRRTSAAHSIVDLVSTDSEGMDDAESEEDDGEGQDSKYFSTHQPPAEVQAWHEQLAQAARNAAPSSSSSRARASSSGSTWRGKNTKSSGKRSFARKASGGFSKGRSTTGISKRKASSKRSSTGSSRSASGAFGPISGGRGGGRGGGGGGGGGSEQRRIDLMPM